MKTKRVYRAGSVVTKGKGVTHSSLNLLVDACVQVIGSRIGKVGPYQDFVPEDGEMTDLGEGVLMPGFINAHCHLELGFTRGILASGQSFPKWVSQLQQSFDSVREGDIDIGIQRGILEALRTGTTTLVDIGNTGKTLEALSKSPLREYAYREVLGLDPKLGLEYFEQTKKQRKSGTWGFSAHAPFSCSPELLTRVINEHKKDKDFPFTIPFTMHLGESTEEWELFTLRGGELYEFCEKKYPQVPGMKKEKGNTAEGEIEWGNPFEYAMDKQFIPKKSLMVHCNLIDVATLEYFKQNQVSIIHCPRSRAFFEHPTFPYELCKEFGVNVALGTDSLASNESLSMFDEMRRFKEEYPQVPSETVLSMATFQGAQALGRGHELGAIQEGYLADFIYVDLPCSNTSESAFFSDLIQSSENVGWIMIDGEVISI